MNIKQVSIMCKHDLVLCSPKLTKCILFCKLLTREPFL